LIIHVGIIGRDTLNIVGNYLSIEEVVLSKNIAKVDALITL
jgi:hypothetical protein